MDTTVEDNTDIIVEKDNPCIPTQQTRPEVLYGFTYKLKNVPNGHGETFNLYITINNDEENKPFEIFADCSDKYLYEFLTAICRNASMMLQYRIPVISVVESLKSIQSDGTSHFIPNSNGTFCPSLVARIALVLEDHYMNRSE